MATYLGLEMDAIVLSVNGDGTFDLKFDDGSVGLCMKPEAIEPSTAPPLSVVSPGLGCQVCFQLHDPWSQSEVIIICENCKAEAHAWCLLLDAEPPEDENYFCPRCKLAQDELATYSCEFCPTKGPGLSPMFPVKGSKRKRWGHGCCGMWIAELFIDSSIEIVGKPAKDRMELKCELCRTQTGAPIQCCVEDCVTAFHPLCAYQRGMLSFMVAENNGKYIETRKNMYCEAHSRFIAKTPGLQHDNLRAVHRALKAAKGVTSVDKKKESEPVSARPSMPVSSSGKEKVLSSSAVPAKTSVSGLLKRLSRDAELYGDESDSDADSASRPPLAKSKAAADSVGVSRGTMGVAASAPKAKRTGPVPTVSGTAPPALQVSRVVSPPVPPKPLKPPRVEYKDVPGTKVDDDTVLDKEAATLHNDSVNRIMRLSLRRAKRVKAAATVPSSAGNTDAAGASSVAGDAPTPTGTDSVGEDGDGGASTSGSASAGDDKKVLQSGSLAKAGPGKKATKALLALWTCGEDVWGLDGYGSGNESGGESGVITQTRAVQRARLEKRGRTPWVSYDVEGLAHRESYNKPDAYVSAVDRYYTLLGSLGFDTASEFGSAAELEVWLNSEAGRSAAPRTSEFEVDSQFTICPSCKKPGYKITTVTTGKEVIESGGCTLCNYRSGKW